MKLHSTILCLLACLLVSMYATPAHAQNDTETYFFEAEKFNVQGDGWKINKGAQARAASRVAALNGSSGAGDSVATQTVDIKNAGPWRLHVHYMLHLSYRGPFVVTVKSGDQVVASRAFDQKPMEARRSWLYVWDSMDLNLKAGKYTIELSKFENKAASGYVRNVDAVILTNDLKLKPDINPYGPQTWMRVTLKDGHEGPVQIHIFADHYRAPWYAHYAVSKAGMEKGLRPKNDNDRLVDGETTGWVNISQAIYQDSGAHLLIYPAHTYHQHAKRFHATIEMAPEPKDEAIVKTFQIDQSPVTLHMVVPGNLESPEEVANLKIDWEFSEAIGKKADNFKWPTIGKKPLKFPFFVSAHLNENMSSKVIERENKTLDYFGFNNVSKAGKETGFTTIGNVGWYYKDTYSNPEIERIEERAPKIQENLAKEGIKKENIILAMVMDEPGGRPAEALAKNEGSQEAFRTWIKSKNLTPKDLLVQSWEDVKIIPEAQAKQFPGLHYYSQQFRTVELGNFIAIQKRLLHKTWDADFPVNVNFSDGAVYYANFYGQGVDYFTLLRETDQNAIWSEDWSNRSSSFHCATYNVELMRGAARDGGQHMGQHLIAYAGRKGYDIRLKAVSEAARGVKMFKSYAYGPQWAGHDRSAWQQHESLWFDHATVIREIGAVEDMLMPAMPKQADVALLYSSATDIWSRDNNAYGFDRMHTWMALAHAQVPVDVVHEKQIENDALKNYKVVYYSGPNITAAAADKLAQWVKGGGTLILTAGAGMKDEYDRPLTTLDELLPYKRNEAQTLQAYVYAGRDLVHLAPKDTVTQGNAKIDVLSVKQNFVNVKPAATVKVLGQYADGQPAAIATQGLKAGKGRVVSLGYLPALDYIKKALDAKAKFIDLNAGIENEGDAQDGVPGQEAILKMLPNEKSYNPWDYPAAIREVITQPVDQAVAAKTLELPISCNVPLVDAVYMICDQGVLVPLANYTLNPIKEMTLEIAIDKPVKEVRSVHQGKLKVTQINAKRIRVTLPLECTDFVSVVY